jgi:hypothetical protein
MCSAETDYGLTTEYYTRIKIHLNDKYSSLFAGSVSNEGKKIDIITRSYKENLE